MIPTTPFDWYNYMSQNVNSNALIQFVFKFNQSIRLLQLQKALQNTLKREPILSSVFDIRCPQPQWTYQETQIETICRFFETTAIEFEIRRFLAEKIEASTEIPIKMLLLGTAPNQAHTLIIKIHHAACDAKSAMEAVKLLAQMYSKLQTEPQFEPSAKTLQREVNSIYDAFKVVDKKARFNPTLLPDMSSTWQMPKGLQNAKQEFDYQMLQIPAEAIAKLKQLAAKQSVTLNALITALYAQSLIQLLRPESARKEIQFTINLRPFSQDEASYSICNLSTILNIQFSVSDHIWALIQEINQAILKVVEPEQILQVVLACDLMSADFESLQKNYQAEWDQIQTTGLTTPMISNIGLLDKSLIHFAESQVEDLYVVPPAFKSPALMVAVSAYHRNTTFCIAYQKPSTAPEFVKTLLNTIHYNFQNLLKNEQ